MTTTVLGPRVVQVNTAKFPAKNGEGPRVGVRLWVADKDLNPDRFTAGGSAEVRYRAPGGEWKSRAVQPELFENRSGGHNHLLVGTNLPHDTDAVQISLVDAEGNQVLGQRPGEAWTVGENPSKYYDAQLFNFDR